LCSYSINEHITDREATKGSASLAAWQDPSRSYMILEASDSEIEGDELDELLFQHTGGTNILYMDGHVKWLKAEYKTTGLGPKDKLNWISPRYDPGGDPRGVGPWTAPDND
jgi:prepilin-type processing-associated H-X9-DG protein